jgi:hypothetical protein
MPWLPDGHARVGCPEVDSDRLPVDLGACHLRSTRQKNGRVVK